MKNDDEFQTIFDMKFPGETRIECTSLGKDWDPTSQMGILASNKMIN